MDVSNQQEPGGEELVATVVMNTGLPANLMEKELNTIIESSGQSSADLTIEGLRAAMIAYLESIHQDMMETDAENPAAPVSTD